MPKKTFTRSIRQVLHSSTSRLERLADHVKTLETLNRRLHQLLPPPLPQHCAAAKLNQQVLVVVVDSPTWATRLRLHSSRIIKELEDFQVQAVTIKVHPARSQPKSTSKPRPEMSSETSNLLIQLAETTSDIKLKNSLRRLSKHASKKIP